MTFREGYSLWKHNSNKHRDWNIFQGRVCIDRGITRGHKIWRHRRTLKIWVSVCVDCVPMRQRFREKPVGTAKRVVRCRGNGRDKINGFIMEWARLPKWGPSLLIFIRRQTFHHSSWETDSSTSNTAEIKPIHDGGSYLFTEYVSRQIYWRVYGNITCINIVNEKNKTLKIY